MSRRIAILQPRELRMVEADFSIPESPTTYLSAYLAQSQSRDGAMCTLVASLIATSTNAYARPE